MFPFDNVVMFYIFVNLHYNYSCISEIDQRAFLCAIIILHKYFNKSQMTFQNVLGKRRLSLSD